MLQQLGINQTAIIQFAIFAATFFILIKYIYTPYSEALNHRLQKTKGTADITNEIQKKSVELHSEYALKAREMHNKISEIFKIARAEAAVECEKIIEKARVDAKNLLDINTKEMVTHTEKIKLGLEKETPMVALTISNKLLGKQSE